MSWYVLLSLILLLAVIFATTYKNEGKKILLGVFSALLVVSVWLLAGHIYSSDKEFYKNVETHAIEHLGYEFANTHELNFINDDKPTKALFDDEQGLFTIKVNTDQPEKPFQITYEDLGKPLWISTDTIGNNYKIANDSLPVWNPNDSLKIQFSTNRKLTCLYTVDAKKKHFFTFSFHDKIKKEVNGKIIEEPKTVTDTIVRNRLVIGYSLLDMIEKCFDIELTESEVEALEETYLVRNTIYSNPRGKALPPLHIYPGKLQKHTTVSLGENPMLSVAKTQTIALGDKNYFYLGIGQNQSDKFQLNYKENRSTLDYKSHLRYPLYFNDTLPKAELLISTSVDDIIKSSREYNGVINFEGRNTYNNIYHVNASLKYAIEDGQTKLNALKIDNNSGKIELDTIKENKQFVLKTNTKNLDYLVQVTNFNTNMLTKWYWLPFLLLLLAAIAFYFVIHKYAKTLNCAGDGDSAASKMLNALKIEYSMYWVIAVFLTVRIYLLWRMYAFPPLEDITYFEFEKLQNMDSFKWTIYALLGFLFVRFGYLTYQIWEPRIPFQYKYEDFMHEINMRPLIQKIGICALIWASVILFLFVFKSTILFVTTSILLPLFCFIFIDSKIPDTHDEMDWKMQGIRLVNFIVYIGLYFAFDAGFCLVAIAVGSLYFLIKNAYFLLRQKPKNRKNRYWITAICLVGFFSVFFAHYIIPIGGLLGDRITARGEIIYKKTGDMISDAGFNSEKSRYILWASESHWFANNHLYERIVNNAEYKFPNIRTQYNSRGVSLTVQTREFAVLRYLIFEHNIWLPILLIAHFLALLLIVAYYYYPKKSEKPLHYFNILGAISLFLILSTIMYLVCLNGIIFIGQDFPFLTLTGNASIIIPFALFCYIILYLNYANLNYIQDNKPTKMPVPAFALSGILALLIFGKVFSTFSEMNDPKLITHEAKQPVERLKSFVDIMNAEFRTFQKAYKNTKKEEKAKTKNKKGKKTSEDLKYEDLKNLYKAYLGQTKPDRERKIDSMVSKYVKDTKGKEKILDKEGKEKKDEGTYLRSALKSFDINNAENLEHIIHIRKKRYSDQFEFVVNRNYYRIKPIFESSKDNPNWRGDLLAMETPNEYYFQPVQEKKRDSLFQQEQLIDRRAKENKPITLDKRMFGKEYSKSQLIKFYRIPSRWLFTEDDAIVAKISNEETTKKLTLSNRTRIYKEENARGFSDFILQNGDILKIEDDDYKTFRVSYNTENYLALNYNYNGKQRFFYPLGKGMIWAYNYSKLLERNYEGKPDKEAKRSTFDFQLQKKLYDLAINQAEDIHDDFFVTVMDGEGHIRAMFDYNREKQNYKINPNDYRKLSKIYEEIYFNTRQEDLTLGTRNIRKMTASGGFGSTIKPIIYGAVTSQKRINWEDIKLNNLFSDKIYSAPDNPKLSGEQIEYIGSRKLVTPWLEKTGEFKGEIDNKRYITNSKNSYNGIIMLLGSYTNKRLGNYIDEILRPDSDSIDIVERFPRFKIKVKNKERNYVLRRDFYDKLPKSLNNDNYVLKSGLLNNFDFDISRKKRNSALDSSYSTFNSKNKINTFYNTEKLFDEAVTKSDFNYQWVFPEKQAFIKNSTNIPGEDLYNNIINPAKGGSPFELTQLGMLENIVRLYKLNQNVKASVYEQKDRIYNKKEFAVDDESWKDKEQYYKFVRNYIYQSMNDVPKNAILGVDKTFTKTAADGKEVTFYVYAKTGTHNSDKNRKKINDKSLIVVISDVDLTKDTKEERTPKLYAMLLTINSVHNDVYKKKQKKLFNEIINSESFNLYFGL
jgi:hypothetical protein